jgi:glycopeptide antibiotics resistance protein
MASKMNLLSKTVLSIYLIVLLWLVLFKFSAHPLSVLSNYQRRSLNLIPFAGTSLSNLYQIIENVIAFIPFGLLLNINFKEINFRRKLAYICALSIIIEITQYIFAIGSTDITDVITNTLGGLIGLLFYDAAVEDIKSKKVDEFIVLGNAVLLIVFILLRTLVFRVRYHSH